MVITNKTINKGEITKLILWTICFIHDHMKKHQAHCTLIAFNPPQQNCDTICQIQHYQNDLCQTYQFIHIQKYDALLMFDCIENCRVIIPKSCLFYYTSYKVIVHYTQIFIPSFYDSVQYHCNGILHYHK